MAFMAMSEAGLSLERTSAVRSVLGTLANLFLPPVCIVCRTRIGAHGLLCGTCFAKIDFIAPPIYDRLGVPLPYDAGSPSLSAQAIAEPPVYDRGARRGALFLHHARAGPGLQISGPARGSRGGQARSENTVVVDDVIKTGATAEACALVLKRAKAARVDVLTLARAV
jgi:predicted amidophosphoribosyltransferase